MFELVMTDSGGTEFILDYDPHTSTLKNKLGEIAVPHETRTWKEIHRVSPENPDRKDAEKIVRLKIQLGLQCNYSCSYCLQAAQIDSAAKTSTRDAQMFLFHLDKWLKSSPNRIEFWGGEPFLYWNKIKILHEGLVKKFPNAEFLIISNGSLLDDEKIEFMKNNNFVFVISHDGPGQHLRGPDPLDDPEKYFWIKKAVDAGLKMSVNAVISPESYDIERIEKFFKERLGKNVNVNFEGVVINYDNGKSNVFTAQQYQEMARNVAVACMRPLNKVPYSFYLKMNGFFDTLKFQRPSSSLAQKCGMDLPGLIAVDLTGNVLTCQNVGLENHKIGHVFDMKNVALNTAWHWSERKECSGCPLLQLCAGSCMYNEGESWFHSCNNEYYYNMGILAGALFHMFGLVLKEVRGEIVRPDPSEYGVGASLQQ